MLVAVQLLVVTSMEKSSKLDMTLSVEAIHQCTLCGSSADCQVSSSTSPLCDSQTNILNKYCHRSWVGNSSHAELFLDKTQLLAHQGPKRQWMLGQRGSWDLELIQASNYGPCSCSKCSRQAQGRVMLLGFLSQFLRHDLGESLTMWL